MINLIKSYILLITVFSVLYSKTDINIWHQMLYENRKVLREVCDDYEKQNLDIRINLTYRETEELRSSFQAASMGGSGPELIYGPTDQVGPFSVMEIIQPLDALFPQDYFNQFVDNAVVKSDNKIWMVGDVVGNHLMLIYNKKLLSIPPMNTDQLIKLKDSGIKTRDDLADLSSDELIDVIGNLDMDRANEIIIESRKHWFEDKEDGRK